MMALLASISGDIGRFIYELRQGINGIVGGFIFGSNVFSLGLIGMTASTRVHGDKLLKSEVLHIRVSQILGGKIRWRAGRLEIYPDDYCAKMLGDAVDRDCAEDITAVSEIQQFSETRTCPLCGSKRKN
jgi:hypothetical protein